MSLADRMVALFGSSPSGAAGAPAPPRSTGASKRPREAAAEEGGSATEHRVSARRADGSALRKAARRATSSSTSSSRERDILDLTGTQDTNAAVTRGSVSSAAPAVAPAVAPTVTPTVAPAAETKTIQMPTSRELGLCPATGSDTRSVESKRASDLAATAATPSRRRHPAVPTSGPAAEPESPRPFLDSSVPPSTDDAASLIPETQFDSQATQAAESDAGLGARCTERRTRAPDSTEGSAVHSLCVSVQQLRSEHTGLHSQIDDLVCELVVWQERCQAAEAQLAAERQMHAAEIRRLTAGRGHLPAAAPGPAVLS